ncbi:MAG: zinc metalloprotease HtpX [Bryobacterales bacterium]|jgi:heat shock protein HtpX|nr:zinc metalloprotease HtpX [Bryobacterales bacterium]
MNHVKSAMLLALLTALLLFLGQAIAGESGLMMAIVMALVMNFGSYWFSDKIVLAMYGGREVTEREAPELVQMTRQLAMQANMPMPKVYILDEQAPNAFATGRSPKKGAVAVSAGLLQMLNRDELAGVIAHELAHIQNRDTLIMTIAGTIAGALSYLSQMAMWGMLFRGGNDDREGPNPIAALLGIVIAPVAAGIIQMAISRSREYIADARGAQISGSPMGLANALRKIESYAKRVPMEHGNPATAHLFIVNPFVGGLAGLFRTHPETAERIALLERMAMTGEYRA